MFLIYAVITIMRGMADSSSGIEIHNGYNASDISRTTDVLRGTDAITTAVLEFIDHTKRSYDVYAESSIPSFIVKEHIIRKFLDFKNNRNGRIRYITEITPDNIGYCKKIMKVADLRHIGGVRGAFRVNETECHYMVVLDELKRFAIMVRSNLTEVVNHHQTMFNAIWEEATTAQARIREIEQQADREREETRLPNTVEPADRFLQESSKQEQLGTPSAAIIAHIPNYGKEYSTPSSRHNIQLWSNQSKSEYAIRIDGNAHVLAATDAEDIGQYTNLIEESDYLTDIQYNWQYTLRHWIKNYTRTN